MSIDDIQIYSKGIRSIDTDTHTKQPCIMYHGLFDVNLVNLAFTAEKKDCEATNMETQQPSAMQMFTISSQAQRGNYIGTGQIEDASKEHLTQVGTCDTNRISIG